MPSRALSDEMMPEEEAPLPEAPRELPELQLPLSPAHQKTAVQTILSDFQVAKDARESRDFGYGAKGEKRSFEEYLKLLKDPYYGRREPKTEPWKYCSNRSLMIAMSILETLHARLFGGVYNEELTRWRPGEINDAAKANRIEKLMFWWIPVRSKLRDFFDRWTRYTIAMPFSVSETLWDVMLLDKGEMVETPQIPGIVPAAPQKKLTPLER